MRYDVVTIVASRRGGSQLRELVAQLPPQFGIPIVCMAEGDAHLVAELAACTRLRVQWAEGGERLLPGTIYLSPPEASVVMRDDRRIAISPVSPESASLRPVDAFLASTSRVYGDRALTIILAAFDEDGAEGAHNVKWRGGTVLVLDRATAEYYGLADAIVKAGSYDRILTAVEVADAMRSTFTGRDLLASAELHFQLGALLDRSLRMAGTHMGDIQLAEDATDRLHIVAHRGVGKTYLDRFAIVRVDDALPCTKALRLHSRVVVEDLMATPEYAAHHAVAQATGYRALQSTPIRGSGRISGVLSTLYPFPHAVSAHEAQTLDEIARAAGSLLER